MPCVDNCVRVDLRTVSFDVPPQEVLTKDSVTVSVDAVVYYRIKEPLNAVIKIANYRYEYFPELYRGRKRERKRFLIPYMLL